MNPNQPTIEFLETELEHLKETHKTQQELIEIRKNMLQESILEHDNRITLISNIQETIDELKKFNSEPT